MINKKITLVAVAVILLAVLGWLIFRNKTGTENAPSSNNTETQNGGNNTNGGKKASVAGVTVPTGATLSVYAKDVPGARVIEIDPKGRILVSETNAGKIVALTDTDNDNVADQQTVLASGLAKPHGMAFKCTNSNCMLYVVEQGQLSRYNYDADKPALTGKQKLIPLNSSSLDRHFTRSLLFLPAPNDNTLLISVGSECDVCNEKETDYATVIAYNVATGTQEVYAKGLRNATFMTLNPVTGKVFATEMGRDNLGDNIPPDEINILEKKNNIAQNYGWPICYGKNIHDTEFDKNTYIRNPCMEPFETSSYVDLQAHSAPLGLAFIPEEGWPEDYRYDLLVAYHGSWNRSVPTGYKIVRLKMNAKGEYEGGIEDFITGWLPANAKKGDDAIGRPVDIKVLSGGVAYITDDLKGVVYRLEMNP